MTWPKLSETLEGPRTPGCCQACAAIELPEMERALHVWQECDENDRGTDVLVYLCGPCSDKIIKPHPRLYRRLWTPMPLPGAMPICTDCTHREGLRCTHALLKANGGPGLELAVPKPAHAHLNYGGGRGEFVKMYPYWPRGCKGREVAEPATT